MKEKTIRSAKILVFTVMVALIFSGFTNAAQSDDETEAAKLMQKRTQIMQRAMFGKISEADIYSELSGIEMHPLLKDDMASIASCRGSDTDKVVNMKIARCRMTTKKATIRFYEITIRWYMLGCDGYYTQDETYNVRTVTNGTTMRLSYIEPV